MSGRSVLRYIYSCLISCSVVVSVANAQESKSEEREIGEGDIKLRTEWFDTRQLAGPEKDIATARERAYKQYLVQPNHLSLKQTTLADLPAWVPVGGSQGGLTSGRTTGIAFDPTTKGVYYLATAQGGLWKSTDAGVTWTGLSDSWQTLRTGAVAVDPNDPNIIYAGTGDPDPATLSGTTYQSSTDGVGVYRSTDGGLNWTLWATKSNSEPRISQVVVNPKNSAQVYVAGSSGIRMTTDGGANWTNILSTGSGTGNSTLANLVIDPTAPNLVVAVANGIVYRSENGGASWKDTLSYLFHTNGLPQFSRGTLAYCLNTPSTIYLSASKADGSLAGICMSTDHGATWQLTANSTATNYLFTQGWYANAIAVDPNDPTHIVVGGLDVYESHNSGATLSQISYQWSSPGATTYTHADIHQVIYGDGALFALTDGGIYRTAPDNISWTSSLNKGLSTLQFVGGDADPNFTYVIGGCQDNGVNRATIGSQSFTKTGEGDGGNTYVSQKDGLTVYSTYYQANFRKSTDGGKNWANGGGNIIQNDTLASQENAPFYMSYSVFASDPKRVAVCGNSRVWLTTNGGSGRLGFTSISKKGEIVGGPTTVHIADANKQVIYAGSNLSSTGSHYVYVNTGASWKRSKSTVGYVTQIITDPNDAGHAWLCTAGYGSSHVYESTDTGYTWVSHAVDLPSVPCNAIARAANGELFVGNDFGVLRSPDNGVHWFKLDNGIPLVQIFTLSLRANDTRLLATTYGRGMYYLDVTKLPTITVDGVAQNVAAPSDQLTIDALYPNPVVGAVATSRINYTLKAPGNVKIALYDVTGRELRVAYNAFSEAGSRSAAVDLNGLPSGQYIATVTANGSTVSKSLIVTR